MKKILFEDLEILNIRVQELERELFSLGEEFAVAVEQSSETWHDNAPFDVVREKQTRINMELVKLRTIRRESTKLHHKKKEKIDVGSKIILHGKNELRLMVGGFWVGRESADGYRLISSESPVAKTLLGKKTNDHVELPSGEFWIASIE
ncbi:GreA/GreB family elongation factor [Candidatus Saccharibacteria bacterium]|nr:GreA/GreB family elongation factor [Candidatus Saccharibacteria bacterium]